MSLLQHKDLFLTLLVVIPAISKNNTKTRSFQKYSVSCEPGSVLHIWYTTEDNSPFSYKIYILMGETAVKQVIGKLQV